jgi:hypothetical protein
LPLRNLHTLIAFQSYYEHTGVLKYFSVVVHAVWKVSGGQERVESNKTRLLLMNGGDVNLSTEILNITKENGETTCSESGRFSI